MLFSSILTFKYLIFHLGGSFVKLPCPLENNIVLEDVLLVEFGTSCSVPYLKSLFVVGLKMLFPPPVKLLESLFLDFIILSQLFSFGLYNSLSFHVFLVVFVVVIHLTFRQKLCLLLFLLLFFELVFRYIFVVLDISYFIAFRHYHRS